MNSYKQAIRNAHLQSLKQKYLNLIEQANINKQRKEQDYQKSAQDAYFEKMKQVKKLPQYLKALGLSGGGELTELYEVISKYKSSLDELKSERDRYIEDYDRQIVNQTQLMNNAVDEYNAKTALEDYNASKKGKKSGSSTKKEVVPQKVIEGKKVNLGGIYDYVISQ